MINTPFMKSVNSTAKVLQSYLNPQQVSYLILYVTNRCNFRCNFCFYGEEIEKGMKPDELTLDELSLIPEYFAKSLLCGISYYIPEIKALQNQDGLYNDTWMDLTEKDKISFIISNETIIYGTNLPIKKVIIDNIDGEYTQNMLWQLIGRAGRTGKSNEAEIIFMNDNILKNAFIHQDTNFEANVLNNHCKNILSL